jgi:hypothetical protein
MPAEAPSRPFGRVQMAFPVLELIAVLLVSTSEFSVTYVDLGE